MKNEPKNLNRQIWLIKLAAILVGYLILGMFQHTLDPRNFSFFCTCLFAGWTFIWVRAEVSTKPLEPYQPFVYIEGEYCEILENQQRIYDALI